MKNLYIVIFICTSLLTNAQKYHPDRIRINSKEYDYRQHHLEQYFNYYPEKRIVPNIDTTLVNRGYIATYEIFDDQIFLLDLEIPRTKNDFRQLKSIREKFSTSKSERIPLRWVNGVIHIGIGEDSFKKDSLMPTNTNNLILEIQKGRVVRTENFNKEEIRVFKNFQWNKFYTTREYYVIYNKLKKLGYLEGEITKHIFDNLLYYSKKIHLRK